MLSTSNETSAAPSTPSPQPSFPNSTTSLLSSGAPMLPRKLLGTRKFTGEKRERRPAGRALPDAAADGLSSVRRLMMNRLTNTGGWAAGERRNG